MRLEIHNLTCCRYTTEAAMESSAQRQVLTLYLTPVVYLYCERLQEWLQGSSPTIREGVGAGIYILPNGRATAPLRGL